MPPMIAESPFPMSQRPLPPPSRCSAALGGGQFGYYLAQLQHLDGALGPIVFPADDQVAQAGVVAVVAEVAALELEFNADALPAVAAPVDAAARDAIREAMRKAFDLEAQFVGEHAEQENDADLVG